MDAQIDENLRRIFEQDVGEDVPAHLQELIARLGDVDANADTTERSADTVDAKAEVNR
jgi:hypothetical protein